MSAYRSAVEKVRQTVRGVAERPWYRRTPIYVASEGWETEALAIANDPATSSDRERIAIRLLRRNGHVVEYDHSIKEWVFR